MKIWLLSLLITNLIINQSKAQINAKQIDSLFLLTLSSNIITNHNYPKITIDSLFEKPCFPLDSFKLTCAYGIRTHPVTKVKNSFHSGIDLRAHKEIVYSVLSGNVITTGYNTIIGNFIRVAHGYYTTIYGHLSLTFVHPGDLVKPGTPIGLSGATGRVTGEHLHFSVRYKDKFLNPLLFLNTIMLLNANTLDYVLNH